MRDNKEIPGTHHCIVLPIPQVPRQCTFLFDLSETSYVVFYLGGFSSKEEDLAGMGLLHLGGTESNISFSIGNLHLCHLNSIHKL